MRSLFALAVLLLFSQKSAAQFTFQPMPNMAFLDSSAYLNGVSWVDVNKDGRLDVCVSGFGGIGPNWVNRSAIFLHQGKDVFANTGLLNSAQQIPMRHGWADFDNDDDPDLYLGSTWNANTINELWQNENGTAMTLVSNSGATPNQSQPYEGTVSWADFDNDGWADLFLPRWNALKNRLFHNNQNGTFTEIGNSAVTADKDWTSGGFWGDFDNDRDQDLLVVKYQLGSGGVGNCDLFQNNGNGTFSKMANAGPLVSQTQNFRSANWVDANNDGWLDVFTCAQFGQDFLHLNQHDGTFLAMPVGAGGHTSWSSNWGDFDNDGDQDLITVGFWGTDSRFWANDGAGNLTDITDQYPAVFPLQTSGSNSNGIVWVDYDGDGWLDLHLTQPDAAPDLFFRNESCPKNSWLEVDCIGQQSNHSAIGATIRAKANFGGQNRWQMRQISAQTAATGTLPFRQHFGFAEAKLIDSLVVEWPSGKTCVFTKIAVNQRLVVLEDCENFGFGYNHFGLQTCADGPETDFSQTVPPGGTWSSDCGACLSADGHFFPEKSPAGNHLLVYSESGFCQKQDSFWVDVFPLPVLEVSYDTLVFPGKTVELTATGADEYKWFSSQNLSCTDCANPTFTAQDSIATFTVVGKNFQGCMDTLTFTIRVKPNVKFWMPTAFTPNGDGKNDVFGPAHAGDEALFKDYHLTIYNRWGGLVYDISGLAIGWDGTREGALMASDVYVYVFEYELVTGEKGTRSGEVNLLR